MPAARFSQRFLRRAVVQPTAPWEPPRASSKRLREAQKASNAFLALQGVVDDEAVQREAFEAAKARGEIPEDQEFFPTMAVIAALNAVDFQMPENLAERALKIATMALNGAKLDEISKELDIHPKVVEAELARIYKSRSMALQATPELGAKVIESTFDVVKCSENLIEQSLEVLSVLKETIIAEHQSALIDRQDYAEDQKRGWQDEDEHGHKTRREKPKYPKGVSPFIVEALWHGLDAIGKHQDRIHGILNPMSKEVMKPGFGDTAAQTTINAVISFHSEALNQAASKLLEAAGQIPVGLPKTIEVQAASVDASKGVN